MEVDYKSQYLITLGRLVEGDTKIAQLEKALKSSEARRLGYLDATNKWIADNAALESELAQVKAQIEAAEKIVRWAEREAGNLEAVAYFAQKEKK